MSTILSVEKIRRHAYWLNLSCGHRYKWTGPYVPPAVGDTLDCPEDSPITAVHPSTTP